MSAEPVAVTSPKNERLPRLPTLAVVMYTHAPRRLEVRG